MASGVGIQIPESCLLALGGGGWVSEQRLCVTCVPIGGAFYFEDIL